MPFRPPLCNRFSSPEIIALFADVHRRGALLSSAKATDGDLPGIQNDLQLSVLGLLQGSFPELPSLPHSPKAQYSRLDNSTITNSFIILARLASNIRKSPCSNHYNPYEPHFRQLPMSFSISLAIQLYIYIYIIRLV